MLKNCVYRGKHGELTITELNSHVKITNDTIYVGSEYIIVKHLCNHIYIKVTMCTS